MKGGVVGGASFLNLLLCSCISVYTHVHGGYSAHVAFRGQFVEVLSFHHLGPRDYLGGQAWWRASLPTDHPHQPTGEPFISFYFLF